MAGILRMAAIPKGNRWEFVDVEFEIHCKDGLGKEFRDESQRPLPYFAQVRKLPMTSPLFSKAKHMRFKRGPGLRDAGSSSGSSPRGSLVRYLSGGSRVNTE